MIKWISDTTNTPDRYIWTIYWKRKMKNKQIGNGRMFYFLSFFSIYSSFFISSHSGRAGSDFCSVLLEKLTVTQHKYEEKKNRKWYFEYSMLKWAFVLYVASKTVHACKSRATIHSIPPCVSPDTMQAPHARHNTRSQQTRWNERVSTKHLWYMCASLCRRRNIWY